MPWRPDRLALLAALLGCAVMCGVALAAPPPRDAALDRTIAYLQRAQNADGGFGAEPGRESDPMVSAWVAYALAAAGVHPQDQATPGGGDAFSYLAANTGEFSYTTDWERVLLVANVSGSSPRDFGGVDLVARVLERQLPDGSFAHQAGGRTGGVNDTAFAVIALSQVDDPAARAALPRAVDWLLDAQREDGAWGVGTGSSDITGAVIQALIAGGRRDTEAQARGFEYLRTLQHDNGGFAFGVPGEEPNVASTAWVVQAMWAAGIDPGSWRKAAGDPLDYLASMQQQDGSIRWSASKDSARVWMTAYVAPAFAGHPLPIPPVARSVKPSPTATATATPTGTPAADPGAGGTAPGTGEGATAGGGGAGAPLFSRPQPQSQGRTRGGVRRVRPGRERPRATPTATPRGSRERSTDAAPGATPEAAPGATPEPAAPDSPAATPADTTAGGGAGPGLAGDPGGGGDGGDASLPYVEGTIVSTQVDAVALPAAPGARAAGAGGAADAAALAIAFALALAVAGGWMVERRGLVKA